MHSLLNPSLHHLTPYQPAKSFSELQRELAQHSICKLGNNENPLGASPRIKEQLSKLLDDIALYPDPTAFELRQALSLHLQVEAEAIIQGNGSADVLAMIGQTFLSANDHVIIPKHSFSLFEVIAHLAGAECELVPLQNWFIDPVAIVQACKSNTKIIFIANPNNPTGTWLTHSQLQFLLDHIPENILLVWDEAYVEFFTGPDRPDALGLLKKHPNLIITRTFSKAYGLAGLRIGYGIAEPALIAAMNRLRLSYNLNIFAGVAGSVALNDVEHLTRTVAHNSSQKRYLENALSEMGLSYLPSATNFLTIHLKLSALPIYIQLLSRGVITRSLDHYGMTEYLGVTVGLAGDNEMFIGALRESL